MSRVTIALVLVSLVVIVATPQTVTRYAFYRVMAERAGAGEARRVFGGSAARLAEYGAACALLDRDRAPRCSATVLAPRWALTAAHCAAPHVRYVQYNARRDTAAVLRLYRHPGYKVVEEDEGQGPDVTTLNHDVGLVRTRRDMTLTDPPALDPLRSMTLYDPLGLTDEEVQVLGFGRTEASLRGERLFEVRLRLVSCERGAWVHCVCGAGRGTEGSRGVCAGDSGGPVLFRGAAVGVTSMGPVECGARAAPPAGATSVFTALYEYAALLNATLRGEETALQMRAVDAAPPSPRAVLELVVTLVVWSAR